MSHREQDIIQDLMEVGLSEREAKVYRVLLGVSEITASAIPRFTDVPRTKVYEALSSLIRKGLCKEVPLSGNEQNGQNGQTFAAVDPKIMLEGLMYEEKKEWHASRASVPISQMYCQIYTAIVPQD